VRRFLRDYPRSEHHDEAQRIERDCLRLLARHELYVAGFYLQRDRPLAAVGRLEYVLAEYPGSGLDPDALLLLGRTRLHMREREVARRTFDDLVARFPDSPVADQARRYLTELEANPSMAEPLDAFGRPIDADAARPGRGAVRSREDDEEEAAEEEEAEAAERAD